MSNRNDSLPLGLVPSLTFVATAARSNTSSLVTSEHIDLSTASTCASATPGPSEKPLQSDMEMSNPGDLDTSLKMNTSLAAPATINFSSLLDPPFPPVDQTSELSNPGMFQLPLDDLDPLNMEMSLALPGTSNCSSLVDPPFLPVDQTCKQAGPSLKALVPQKGFGFHPTDVELVYYLKRKVQEEPFNSIAIGEADVYKLEPWDLPPSDSKWYFFSRPHKSNSGKYSQLTDKGYWKLFRNPRYIKQSGKIIGLKRTLVYYRGRPPTGERTVWVMLEYRMIENPMEYQETSEVKDNRGRLEIQRDQLV